MNIKDSYKQIIKQFVDRNDCEEIVFFIYSNEEYVYKDISNFFTISIGGIPSKAKISEVIDVFDYTDENEEFLLDEDNYDQTAAPVIEYLNEIGIKNIGFEDSENDYDENMYYIGRGPSGLYEMVQLLIEIIIELWTSYNINKPILFVDYEATWYLKEATQEVNKRLGLKSKYMKIFD